MSVQLPLKVGLDDHARFNTFLEGSNAAAVDELRRVGQGVVPISWIWGARGTGKTHLLQAVCAASTEAGNEAAFIPLAQPETLRPEILFGWDNLQLVCLDDIQNVIGDEAWENALFNLFNELTDRGGGMLVAANAAPASIEFALPDLQSRLSWGPVFKLLSLSDEQRIDALRLRARHRGLELSDEVGEWLVRRLPRDMATLYGLLETLDHASLAKKRRLTIPFVKEIIKQSRDLI